MRICTRCGNVATGQQRYCTRCVAPLDPAEPADARPTPWWEDDPYWSEPDAVDDWFAGGEAETSVMPLLVDDPPADGDWGQTSQGGRLHYPSADPRHASAGRRAQIISAALAAVALLAGGVTAWGAFGHHQRMDSGARLSSSSQTTGAARPATPRPRPARSGHPATATPASSPAATPGRGFTVLIAPGLSHNPAASQVDGLLVTYFTAINAHNFGQYASTFLPSVRRQLSPAGFASGYKTTRDSDASLVGLGTAAGHRLAATVTFTSTQQPVPGQGVTGCTYWAITLFLGQHGNGFLIGAEPRGYHPYHHACN
ncbi:MAG TPA: hypothetical protein VIP48_13670 [Streptosporangiaceae bacterium]